MSILYIELGYDSSFFREKLKKKSTFVIASG